jgi:hypothetical protein
VKNHGKEEGMDKKKNVQEIEEAARLCRIRNPGCMTPNDNTQCFTCQEIARGEARSRWQSRSATESAYRAEREQRHTVHAKAIVLATRAHEFSSFFAEPVPNELRRKLEECGLVLDDKYIDLLHSTGLYGDHVQYKSAVSEFFKVRALRTERTYPPTTSEFILFMGKRW